MVVVVLDWKRLEAIVVVIVEWQLLKMVGVIDAIC